MRKIEKKMVDAFRAKRNFKESNTEVRVSGDCVKVFLFGNLICEKSGNHVYFSTCGWNTPTTCSRLNALGCSCRIEKGCIAIY